MDFLPDKLLTHIFSFLPLESRDQVRLVNRRWNRMCNVDSIMRKEKIRIFGKFKPKYCSIVLTQSKRPILNLEICAAFVSLRGGLFSPRFRSQVGERVRSLTFVSCYFHKNSLVKILESCPNLTHLMIENGSLENVLSSLDLAWKSNYKAPKISSFSLYDIESVTEEKAKELSVCLVRILEIMLPNLKKLSIILSVQYLTVSSSEYLQHFKNIIHCIRTRCLHLNSFEFDLRSFSVSKCAEDLTLDILKTAVTFKNLKKLAIPINDAIFAAPTEMKSQLWSLKNITTLSLRNNDKETRSGQRLMLHIFESFPNLRHLKLFKFAVNDFDKTIIEKLLATSLKTLELNVEKAKGMFNELSAVDFKKNETLEVLELKTSLREAKRNDRGVEDVYREAKDVDRWWPVFIRHFQNLLHLRIVGLSDKTLLYTLKYQKRLKSLRIISYSGLLNSELSGIENYPQRGENIKSHFMKNLTELEEFEFASDFKSDLNTIASAFPDQCKVKHLSISVKPSRVWILSDHQPSDSEDETSNAEDRNPVTISAAGASLQNESADGLSNLCSAIEKLPYLEFLELNMDEKLPSDFFLKQCQSHKNLKYIRVRHHSDEKYVKLKYSEIEECFQVRPSLRFLQSNGTTEYFWCMITNRIVKTQSDLSSYIQPPIRISTLSGQKAAWSPIVRRSQILEDIKCSIL